MLPAPNEDSDSELNSTLQTFISRLWIIVTTASAYECVQPWAKEVKSLYLLETDENYLPVDRPLLRKWAIVNFNRLFFSGNVALLSVQHHEHKFEDYMYLIDVVP